MTKHIEDGSYLLQKNNVVLKTKGNLNSRGEVRDNLFRLIQQKKNNRVFWMPLGLWFYNARYNKLHELPDSSLSKLIERPVIFDSASIPRNILLMRSYMFNLGYFYAQVYDSVKYKHKKASVTYYVNTGQNYLVNNLRFDVDDSAIARLIHDNLPVTALKRNKPFTFGMVDEERSRMSAFIRNSGYYKFSQDNIRFVLDTMDKGFLKDVENPLDNAINYITSFKSSKKPTTDVEIYVKTKDDSSNIPYKIREVNVYPDYSGAMGERNIVLMDVEQDGILLHYHDYFVHPKVIADRVFMKPGNLFVQDDYDKTIVQINNLGLFKYVRIQPVENKNDSTIVVNIYLNKNKKYDLNPNFEISSGTTYQLGSSAALSYSDKNFMKGANLLTLKMNGSIELGYSDKLGNSLFEHFSLITRYYGVNASIDLPKFLAPLQKSYFDNSSLPHTIFNIGSNLIDRVAYFTLINNSASFKYNWRKSKTITWELSPAFMNLIQVPKTTAAFQKELDSNAYLRNTYKPIFFEGENLTFVYSNVDKKQGKNFFRLKASIEEAGGLLGGINSLGYALNDLFKIKYAQYTKVDVDAQRYFNFPHSLIAVRMFAGVGLPYGQSTSLPYIKQYYVGGPYSLRGWPIRSLGPGRFNDASGNIYNQALDRTGDIKLEANAEYRFPITPLFAGAVKFNGAFFADAGNIWLAKTDSTTSGGEFALNKLGQDIAMDVGAGARFEIASFLNLRCDVAMPVKKPYNLKNNGWVWDQIDFSNSSWRANNIVINFSIGYPF